MKTSIADLIYLKRLCSRLQSLLRLFDNGKGKYLTKRQKQAILGFSVRPEQGLAEFVRRLHNQSLLIPELHSTDPASLKFYLQMLLALAERQYAVIYSGDMTKLKAVQKELRDKDFYRSMKRNNFISWEDEPFETMIRDFVSHDFEHEYPYELLADLPEKYLAMLEYYWKHRKDIKQTKLWYDFLAISAFMLYGTKLELLTLKKIRKC